MSTNIERFGSMMSDRMKQTSNAAIPTTIELGIVNGDLSITPDSLGAPIPQGEYKVNQMLTGKHETKDETHSHGDGDHAGHTEGTGGHSHTGGKHKHKLPDEYRGLAPGDRVLIAWCETEPVVIAIVV